jgi:hypothetical protein
MNYQIAAGNYREIESIRHQLAKDLGASREIEVDDFQPYYPLGKD